MKKIPTLPICGALFTAAVSFSNAATVADFTDGNGTASVDQYAGIAGSGWAAGWTTRNSATGATATPPNVPTASVSATVTNTSPLNGGGNYLSSTIISSGTDGRGAVSRDYTPITSPYVTVFSFRLDSWTNSGGDSMAGATDYVDIYDYNGGAQSSFGAAGTWSIRAFGAATGVLGAKEWGFYNGGGAGETYGVGNYKNTGISLVAGTVYTFTITFDPAAKSWTGAVTDGVNSFTSTPLGTRANTTTPSGNIHFGASASATGETMVYSVDGVSITAIPEPSVVGLAGLGLVALGMRRRRN